MLMNSSLLLTWALLTMIANAQAAEIVLIGSGNNSAESTAAGPLDDLRTPPSSSHCPQDRVNALSEGHQLVYRVGVLAIRGEEAAFSEFNTTFGEYLTVTAGQRFVPPIRFEMKPLNFLSLFTDTEEGLVDLIYVNPSAFSCIESEYTARSLCSQTSRRKINGNIYDLKKFGGVIMKRADNDKVQSIRDLQGKIIAAASISGLGSGQMQFLEMQKAGMSYINDPKQLVFTSNQGKVVAGVLSGKFDVGFVRTDQIERSKDANGTLLDPNLFKVIDPQPGLNIDGVPFPFESSSPLYPEWNLASLHHVTDDVAEAVQSAMLAIADHSNVAIAQNKCMEEHNNSQPCRWENMPKARCDTTQQIARIALKAREKGKFSAWQPTLSYMQLRSMQENTGFIKMDPTDNIWKCTKSKTLYNSITCPENYYKASEDEVNEACGLQGLDCKDGFQCICSPCVLIVECIDGVDIQGNCVSYSIFLPSLLVPFFLICAVCVHYYVEYKRKQADSVWAVRPEELEFEKPSKVIGRGTFGYVLLAEYRGTKVAVKRVLPPKDSKRLKQRTWMKKYGRGIRASIRAQLNDPPASQERTRQHVQTQEDGSDAYRDSDSNNVAMPDIESQTNPGLKSMNAAQFADSMDESLKRKIHPGLRSMASRLTHSITGTAGSTRRPTHEQLKDDFVKEMRHLAKLRHPCITTVMGAVVDHKAEPMLVMEYMSQGSLYDVLRDESVDLDVDEHILPVLQDIAQGVRFLHAANPQVIHGDLKAKNVLIDSNFRAKVTDFGLSAKKQNSASGTPYWMAPELLRGESSNNAKSDVYAFGILIYEMFSRENPYEGENHIEVLRAICDPRVNKRPPAPPGCSFKVADLMKECVHANPNKRPAAELIDVQLRVEGSVKERTSKLEQLNKELEEANKKIAIASSMQLEHFACMSHEIRTPLNCIVGIASLMEGAGLNASQQESISMIAASSSLLQSIVDDVLDYSKLQSGNAEVDIKRTDIQRVVADLVNAMRASSLSTKRNLTIQTRFQAMSPRHFETDGRRLLQILFNLVSNAVKFSKMNGTVEVNITVADRVKPFGHVEEQETEDVNERRPLVTFSRKVLRFAVKDHGKGIEKKNFHSIFQPFTQTNSGINNIDGGTGLGLAITEKLVRALGGDISVDSCLSEWTEFTVDFPLDEAPICIHDIAAQFKTALIFVVGQDKLVEENLDYFHVGSSRVSSMEELKDAVQALPRKAGAENRAVVSVIVGDLFDEKITKELAVKCGMKAVVVGPKHGLSESIKHFPSLGEIVPSFFMGELGSLVRESLEFRSSQAELLGTDSDEEQPTKPCDLTKLRILCAEDNLVNQKILTRMLKRVGVAEIVVEENGKLAVEKEAEKEFDIVLMDMQMPVMDGIDATKLIVQRQGGHKIPLIVFVTAHVSPTFEAQCLECGATAYLPKPYTLQVLKEVLTETGAKL